jgi:hypothetical protein
VNEMQEVSVPVEDLRAAGYGDEVETVATAVADYLDDGAGGNVAVVSEPYAGRDALLGYAQSLLEGEARWVDLGPGAVEGEGPDLPDGPAHPGTDDEASDERDSGGDAGPAEGGTGAGALIAADCHYLFERRIDGFDALDAFVDRIALSEELVVTSWNRYAWSYLDAVRDIHDSFTTVVEIPPLDATEIETVVETHHEELPTFVDRGSAGRVKTVVFDAATVPLPGRRSVDVPYPKPNPAWTASWTVADADESVRAVTFEKLRRVSNGNPGVALAVWADSLVDGEIAPGDVDAFDADATLDADIAPVLWSVLARESVAVDRLTTVYDDRPVETVLQDLVERGLVTVDGDRVAVAPRALHPVADALERRRLRG